MMAWAVGWICETLMEMSGFPGKPERKATFFFFFNRRLISPYLPARIFRGNTRDVRGPTLVFEGPPLEKTVV